MSTGPNYSNSQHDVITTVSHFEVEFEKMILEEMPNIGVIYDEELTYESGLRSYIAKMNYTQGHIITEPLFIYNRTVMRDSLNPPSKRLNNFNAVMKVDNKAVSYAVSHSEFDIQFMYISKSVELMEKFEVVYSSEEGISSSKQLVVPIGPLGDFKYFLTWNELTEKIINREDSAYKAIIGSVIVRGMFFTFRSTSEIIKQINAKIYASNDILNKSKDELLNGPDGIIIPT